jgi:hypothetical protein
MFNFFEWFCRYFSRWCPCYEQEYKVISDSFYQCNYENVDDSQYISDEEQNVTDSLLGHQTQEYINPRYSDPESISDSDPEPISDSDPDSDPDPEPDPEPVSDPKTSESIDKDFEPIYDNEPAPEPEPEPELGLSRIIPREREQYDRLESSEGSEKTTNSIIINSYKDDPIERIPAPSPRF